MRTKYVDHHQYISNTGVYISVVELNKILYDFKLKVKYHNLIGACWTYGFDHIICFIDLHTIVTLSLLMCAPSFFSLYTYSVIQYSNNNQYTYQIYGLCVSCSYITVIHSYTMTNRGCDSTVTDCFTSITKLLIQAKSTNKCV